MARSSIDEFFSTQLFTAFHYYETNFPSTSSKDWQHKIIIQIYYFELIAPLWRVTGGTIWFQKCRTYLFYDWWATVLKEIGPHVIFKFSVRVSPWRFYIFQSSHPYLKCLEVRGVKWLEDLNRKLSVPRCRGTLYFWRFKSRPPL